MKTTIILTTSTTTTVADSSSSRLVQQDSVAPMMLEEEQLEYSDDEGDVNDSVSYVSASFSPSYEDPKSYYAHHDVPGQGGAGEKVNNHQRSRALIPITRELKIDELDISDHDTIRNNKHNKKDIVNSKSPIRKKIGVVHSDISGTSSAAAVGCTDMMSSSSKDKHVPCACCKAYVRSCTNKDHSKKSNLLASVRSSNRSEEQPNHKSSFTALIGSLLSWPVEGDAKEKDTCPSAGDDYDDEDGNGTENSHCLTDVAKNDYGHRQYHDNPIHATTDFQYTVVKCLMESWLHKKGSGKDIFGSTSWKPRWCQLVLAEVHGYTGQVPLLLASWHSSMPRPSTIIVLDQKIAIAIDALDVTSSQQEATGTQDNQVCYRFDIASDNNQDPQSLVTRTFSSANVDLRNDWVQKINDTICTYERFKKSMALKNVTSKLPPVSPRTKSQLREYSHLEGLDLVY